MDSDIAYYNHYCYLCREPNPCRKMEKLPPTSIHRLLPTFVTRAVIVAFAFFCSCLSYAQDNTTHIELQGESVTKIFKDSRNIMWLGTSNGLISYDGQNYRRFTTDDCKRPFNFVNDICELADGSIIVAMRNGLYKVDFPTKCCNRLCDNLTGISSLERIHNPKNLSHRILVGCQQGIAILDEQNMEVSDILLINKSNITSTDNNIVDMTYDGKNKIWACNTQRTLVCYDINSLRNKTFTLSDSILSSPISGIQIEGDILHIATTNNGLLHFNTLTHDITRDLSITSSIKEISKSHNALYVCTDGGGAYVISNKTTRRQPTLSNSVYSCYYDEATSTMWYGYYQQGFSYTQHKDNLFHTYKFNDFNTAGIFVRSFVKNGRQTVIGTRDGLYFVDEERNIVQHFTPEDIGGAIIMDIKYFAGKYIIANYEHGLFTLDPVTIQLKPFDTDKRHQESSCSRMAISPDGNYLYVGSSIGLIILDTHMNVVEEYDDRHSDILSSYIYDIMFDTTGKLWISTVNGICLFNPENRRFQNKGFPKDYFNTVPNITLGMTSGGDILAASEQTLYSSSSDLAHTREFPLHERLGLGYISFIQQLQIGGTDYFVAGTDCGLFLFDRNFNTFRQYAQPTSLPSPQFQRFNSYIDADGTLWMANAKGLIYCTRSDRHKLLSPVNQQIFVSSYTIDNKEYITNPFDEDRTHITLGWNFGTYEVVLRPILLDYSTHQHQRYYEWTIDDGDTQLCYEDNPISIHSLTLGSHTVRICLAGHPETQQTVHITVAPSAAFYVIIFIALSLIIIAILLLQAQKRRRQLQKAIKQKHQIEIELASSNAVRQHIQRQEEEHAKEETLRKQEKADMLKYKSSEYKELKRRLKTVMEEDKPYLNKNLRISELASMVNTNAGTLSLMLNELMHTNYFDYINHYRIDHFKKLALDPQYSHYTVLAISEMCGFKRSSFFNVFKKFENCTPNEWIKQTRDPHEHS